MKCLTVPLALVVLSSTAIAAEGVDKYQWLEEVRGTRAIEWVETQNTRTLHDLREDARFSVFEQQAAEAYTTTNVDVTGSLFGSYIYNHYKSAERPFGLLRRAKLAELDRAEPSWEMLIDFDALSAAEHEKWVFKGLDCVAPLFDRCMVRLSRGGKDASVWREYSVSTRAFVDGGFMLAEARTALSWVDENTLLVSTDWGDGSLTKSGNSRIVKAWKRATPLAEARTVLEGAADDVYVRPMVLRSGQKNVLKLVNRATSFFESEVYIDGKDGVTKLPIPKKASVAGVLEKRLILKLGEALDNAEESIPAGALVSYDLDDKTFRLIFKPDDKESIFFAVVTRGAVYIQTFKDVKSRLYRVVAQRGEWQVRQLPMPDNGFIFVRSWNEASDELLATFENPITPTSLYRIDKHGEPHLLRAGQAQFDAKGMTVVQRFVETKDGAKLPYFLVGRSDVISVGNAPVELFGYGGFGFPLMPLYAGTTGRLWLERGGLLAIANIRGGGEYGPEWHAAAIKTKRQTSYDDFYAIAEDLVSAGVAGKKRIAAYGMSNGGLLSGVALTQRPDLFGAVASFNPLLDMVRYTQFSAGASWIGEYGDPADPVEGKFLAGISPYENVRKGVSYPPVLFYTSTYDDRVHPAHARKMAAKLIDDGQPVYFYENTGGGGHGGAATPKDKALKDAIKYVFLCRSIGCAE